MLSTIWMTLVGIGWIVVVARAVVAITKIIKDSRRETALLEAWYYAEVEHLKELMEDIDATDERND